MSESMELEREQLKQLKVPSMKMFDGQHRRRAIKDSLIELILTLQEQVATQQVLIQELRDQLAKDSHNVIDALYNAFLDQPFFPATDQA